MKPTRSDFLLPTAKQALEAAKLRHWMEGPARSVPILPTVVLAPKKPNQ